MPCIKIIPVTQLPRTVPSSVTNAKKGITNYLPVFDTTDILPHQLPVKVARTQLLYRWHMALNHANTDGIWRTLKAHGHRDARNISDTIMTCSACQTVKLAQAPHKWAVHNVRPGRTLWTKIAGPIDPVGQLVETYVVTVKYIATRLTFLMPLCKNGETLQAICTAIEYSTGVLPKRLPSSTPTMESNLYQWQYIRQLACTLPILARWHRITRSKTASRSASTECY